MSTERFTREVYEDRKRKAINCLHHAIEQAEKDQWFNALYTLGTAVEHGTAALQAIINREEWDR